MKKYYKYIEKVNKNPENYCLSIRQLVQKHEKDLENDDYYFDDYCADHIIKFAERLKHYEDKYKGKNIILEDWQAFFLAMLYGWKKSKDNLRKYKKVYGQIARKNGKSILGAVIVLYHIKCGEAQEVYSIATKRDQAKLIYNKIKGINSQFKKTALRILKNEITVKDSVYMYMDGESKRADGFNPSLVICDEVHAMRNFDLIDVYRDGMGARSQPILFMITTAGYNKGAAYEEYCRCKKVLSGELKDETLLPLIFELDKEDDWEEPTKWKLANPNLGISVSLEYLEDQHNEATQKYTTELSFKTKNLNLWSTDGEDTWINQKEWELCNQDFDYESLIGRRCYAGVDLSGVSDLTGYTLYFPLDDERIASIHKCYIPKGALKNKQKNENSNYYSWVKDRVVIATEGEVIDHLRLVSDIKDDAEKYNIVEVGYDPYKSGNIISFLEDEGFLMVPVKQGLVAFSEPCRSWERSVKNSSIIDQNPVMAWCMSNAVVKPDNHENIVPLKKDKNRYNKIDLVISSVVAHKIMSDNEDGLREEKLKANPYEGWIEAIKKNK